jgi:hypothetical protein
MVVYYLERNGGVGGPPAYKAIYAGNTEKARWQFPPDVERVQDVRFSADGRQILFLQGDKVPRSLGRLATFGAGAAEILLEAPAAPAGENARYFDELKKIKGSDLFSVKVKICSYVYSEEKKLCHNGSDEFSTDTIWVVDAKSGKVIHQVAPTGESGQTYHALVSPDGRRAVFVNLQKGEVSLADLESGAVKQAVMTYLPAYHYRSHYVMWQADSASFLAALPTPGSREDAVQIGFYRVDLDGQVTELGKIASTYLTNNAPQTFFSASGDWAAYNSFLNLYVQNLKTGKTTKLGLLKLYVADYLRFSPDGQQLIYSGFPGLVWADLESGKQWRVTSTPGGIQSWAPDSKACVVWEFEYPPVLAKSDGSVQDILGSMTMTGLGWLNPQAVLFEYNYRLILQDMYSGVGKTISSDADWMTYDFWLSGNPVVWPEK